MNGIKREKVKALRDNRIKNRLFNETINFQNESEQKKLYQEFVQI